MAQRPAATVILTQSTNYGPSRQQVTCPSCHHQVLTEIRSESTRKTHIIAILLCVFLCWPCVCVPYCMDSCKSTNHYCPHCSTYLGTYAN